MVDVEPPTRRLFARAAIRDQVSPDPNMGRRGCRWRSKCRFWGSDVLLENYLVENSDPHAWS
jgi:hypothetical protein